MSGIKRKTAERYRTAIKAKLAFPSSLDERASRVYGLFPRLAYNLFSEKREEDAVYSLSPRFNAARACSSRADIPTFSSNFQLFSFFFFFSLLYTRQREIPRSSFTLIRSGGGEQRLVNFEMVKLLFFYIRDLQSVCIRKSILYSISR